MTHRRTTTPGLILPLMAALLCAIPAGAAAQPAASGNTSSLLPREASVAVTAAGLHQLPLRAEVLADSQPDLRDVRLFDEAENEIPWLLAGTIPAPPAIAAVPLVPTQATQELRRTEYDHEAHFESFVVELPELPADTTGWDLVLATETQELTRSFTVVEHVAGDGREERARGTVFRFLGPLRQRLTIPLHGAAGTYEVTLEGEGEDYLTPTFSAVATRPRASTATVTVPLTVENVDQKDGDTVLTFRRPRGLVPSSLVIATTTATFHRRVQVRDLGPGSETRGLGEGVVFRIPELEGAEELVLALGSAQGDLLEVRVVDGDAGALTDLRVTAVIDQPILVAHLAGDATLRFGGGRLAPPRYDLRRIAQTALGRRLGFHEFPEAALSAPRPNPGYDQTPALAWAMYPGAAVEVFQYHRERSVFLQPTVEGLSRVRLAAEDLAALQPGLADLRVTDQDGHQWPYLIEADAGIQDGSWYPDRVATEVDGVVGSEYQVVVAPRGVPVATLTLRTEAPFVDRDFVLYGQGGRDGTNGAEDEYELTRGRLVRRPGTGEELRIEVGGARAQSLRLVIVDGGDAPLPNLETVVGVPVPDLYIAAHAGDYRLLLGNADAAAPTYEVRRARDLILAVPAAEAFPAPLVENQDYLPPRLPVNFQDWLLWGMLILAILVLGALTLRATRNEAPAGPPEGAPGGGTSDTGEGPGPRKPQKPQESQESQEPTSPAPEDPGAPASGPKAG